MAGFGDAQLLGADARLLCASGENGEDDAGGGCGLPRSYPLSTSFCSVSAKKKRRKFMMHNYNTRTLGHLFPQHCLFVS